MERRVSKKNRKYQVKERNIKPAFASGRQVKSGYDYKVGDCD